MAETKKKVNVADIMQRAKDKTNLVKESTVKVQSKSANFRIVPGLTKYEFNGNILRNYKTKKILSFKTGRNKYQLMDDNGENRNLSNDDLRNLIPEEKIQDKPIKKEKIEKQKKVKISNVEIQPDLESEKLKVSDFSKKDIVYSDFKNHKKHYMLHLKGCDSKEINELTEAPIPSIKRDIWRYLVGKTVL